MKNNISINIRAHAKYLPEQSSEPSQRFIWAYEIFIENKSEEVVQLLNRYWRITDMTGHVEEVLGPGVIGLQPLIFPSRDFDYSSFCQLGTPKGSMEGHYEMQNLKEERFLIQIPKFVLETPETVTTAFRSRLH